MATTRFNMKHWKQPKQPLSLMQAFGFGPKSTSQFKPPQLTATLPEDTQQAAVAENKPKHNSPVPTAGEAGKNAALGKQMAEAAPYNWHGEQWIALNNLWTRESGWITTAQNPSSGAYGIPQSLPASKMASAGKDYKSDPRTQIDWGLEYIRSTYGDPVHAWMHELSHGWY
jgi:resuscitation-promoting factor RpfB